MSHHELQRWMVLMLHDPDLVDRVYADPDRALADADLDARERGWLVAPDRRAWKTDPYRRARLLVGLIDEYPTAMAWVMRHLGMDPLVGFFSSTSFAKCVFQRGSLALTFGEWIEGRDLGIINALTSVELAIARVRRAPPAVPGPANDPGPDDVLQLAPGIEPVTVPEGTVELMAKIRARLESHPDPLREAVVDEAFDLRAEPSDSTEFEHILVDVGPQGPQLGFASEALVDLLTAAREPSRAELLFKAALEAGADPGTEVEIVSSLVCDGSLVRV